MHRQLSAKTLCPLIAHVLVLVLSVSQVTYGSDPTQETAFYCPSFKNCSGNTCRYNRIAPTTGTKTFTENLTATMGCDDLGVEFDYPDIVGDSFVGNESWTCFRYYDSLGHHFAIGKITLDKPSFVSSTQVNCKAGTDNCTLLEEKETELIYVAGQPSDCVPWIDISNNVTDPSRESAFYCPSYQNCTEDTCRFNGIAPTSLSKSFKKGEKVGMACDGMDVEFTYPEGKDESFVENVTWTCYRYYDSVGHHFVIGKITLNKPSGVNGSQFNCTTNTDDCTLLRETSAELIFVAGLPNSCSPYKESKALITAPGEMIYCPYYRNCTGNHCAFNVTSRNTTTKGFNTGEGMELKCETMEVSIVYPETSDESFKGSKTYTCFQYDNNNGTKFPAFEVTLNKPNDISGSQVDCTSDIENCTLLEEKPGELIYVAGLPNTCVPWSDVVSNAMDPSQETQFCCPNFQNCNGETCLFNRMAPTTLSKNFNKSEKVEMGCDGLNVEFSYPDSNDERFIAHLNWTCFRYYDSIGHHFIIGKITINKPSDMNGNQFNCTTNMGDCTLLRETSAELLFVAGLPDNCVNGTCKDIPEPPVTKETPTAAPNTTETTGTDAPTGTPNATGTPGTEVPPATAPSSSWQMKQNWAAIVLMAATLLLVSSKNNL